MKYLFIDDDGALLREMQVAFAKYPQMVFAKCHNVWEALQAVATHQPDVLFLDHHLDENCTDDGFEIVDRLKDSGITIYSTTTRADKQEKYRQRGIESIEKTDLPKYKSIISPVSVALQSAKLEVTRRAPTSYAEVARQTMLALVEEHRHDHPLYQQTCVTESVIDEERQLAVCILFEQIDTDRSSSGTEGWLGDQFRYSVWKMNGDNKPVRLHEDHAYIRPRTKSEMTGTRGRDCTIKDLRLEGNEIKAQYRKGEKFEMQTWKELTLMV